MPGVLIGVFLGLRVNIGSTRAGNPRPEMEIEREPRGQVHNHLRVGRVPRGLLVRDLVIKGRGVLDFLKVQEIRYHTALYLVDKQLVDLIFLEKTLRVIVLVKHDIQAEDTRRSLYRDIGIKENLPGIGREIIGVRGEQRLGAGFGHRVRPPFLDQPLSQHAVPLHRVVVEILRPGVAAIASCRGDVFPLDKLPGITERQRVQA